MSNSIFGMFKRTSREKANSEGIIDSGASSGDASRLEPAPPLRTVTSSSLKGPMSKAGTLKWRLFSRRKAKATDDSVLQATVIDGSQSNPPQASSDLLSRRVEMKIKEDAVDPAKQQAMLDMGIGLVGLFQKIAELTELAVPGPIGDILENISGVLKVLKKMIENKEAWKDLLRTLDNHQRTLNDQLLRLNKAEGEPGTNPALLKPIKEYSETLAILAAKIMTDSGFEFEGVKEKSSWKKMGDFFKQYLEADDVQGKVQDYQKQLTDALQVLLVQLDLLTASTVQDIARTVEVTAKVVAEIRMTMKGGDMISSGSGHTKVPAKTIPAVTPNFVMRETLWEVMVNALINSPPSECNVFPIIGMGGCGKTQMVSYLLQEKASRYKHIIYGDAKSAATIKADLQVWIQSLGDGHEGSSWEEALSFLSAATDDRRWVLVFDNADDQELDLVPFIPTCKIGTVIITSRNRKIVTLATSHYLEVQQMTKDEALSTLLRAARRQLPLAAEELSHCQELLEELGCLPLALVQAGAYCRHLSSTDHPYTFTQYISQFHRNRVRLMEEAQSPSLDRYQRSVYATLNISYEAIPAMVQKFLHLLSFFNPSGISTNIFSAAAEAHFSDPEMSVSRPADHQKVISDLEALLCRDGESTEWNVEETVRNLLSFSLINVASISNIVVIRLHPLVQAWAQDILPPPERIHYRRMATQVITTCAASGNVTLMQYLVPHIIRMLDLPETEQPHFIDMILFSTILRDQSHYHLAETISKRTLEIMERTIGRNDPATIEVIAIVASTCRWLGNCDEAETLGAEVLERYTRLLGAKSPEAIDAAADLAWTYTEQRRWSDAEKLNLRVLQQRQRTLTQDDPSTIWAKADMASTLKEMGRLKEAATLEMEIIRQRVRILGKDHIDTLWASVNLADTYSRQGQLRKSEQMGLEALEGLKRNAGEDHHQTIRAAINLASTYRSQERWQLAEKLGVEILEQRRQALGNEHPNTLWAASELGWTYCEEGNWPEGTKLIEETLEYRNYINGEDHLDTLEVAATLADAYRGQDRLSESEEINVRILENRTRILGAENPHTLLAATDLAETYFAQHRWDEAEKLYMETLGNQRRLLEKDHPDTMRVALKLAETHREQMRLTEAEELGTYVPGSRRRVLEKDHPDTIAAAQSLVRTYRAQGRLDAAEKLDVESTEAIARRDRLYA